MGCTETPAPGWQSIEARGKALAVEVKRIWRSGPITDEAREVPVPASAGARAVPIPSTMIGKTT
jgi:hypothetical protein